MVLQRFFLSKQSNPLCFATALTLGAICLYLLFFDTPGNATLSPNVLRNEPGQQQTVEDVHQQLEDLTQPDPAPLMKLLVLTYNRYQSLTRLLDSLNAAVYDGHSVSLEIHVDRSKEGLVSEETVQAARAFQFKHGPCSVLVKTQHGGIVGQWLDSWKMPEHDASEIAVFLEDDLTVSPYFARWLRLVHAKYDSYPGINGYSMHTDACRHAHGSVNKDLVAPSGQSVFLYPVMGSWGFSPKTAAWRDMIRWYQEASQNRSFLPLVPGLKPSDWYLQAYNQRRPDSMWTAWHIYHAYKNHLFTLFNIPPDRLGLSFNWKEPGEHYSKSSPNIKPKLMMSWPKEGLQLPEELIVLDAKGEMTGQKLTRRGFSQH